MFVVVIVVVTDDHQCCMCALRMTAAVGDIDYVYLQNGKYEKMFAKLFVGHEKCNGCDTGT